MSRRAVEIVGRNEGTFDRNAHPAPSQLIHHLVITQGGADEYTVDNVLEWLGDGVGLDADDDGDGPRVVVVCTRCDETFEPDWVNVTSRRKMIRSLVPLSAVLEWKTAHVCRANDVGAIGT